MPLIYSQQSPTEVAKHLNSTATHADPSFLVVYASHVGGRSWCGDCRDAEPVVERVLGSRGGDVEVVHVGGRDEWQKSENPWRRHPFLIERLPTIIKVLGSGEWVRLVESDVSNEEKLVEFIGDAKGFAGTS